MQKLTVSLYDGVRRPFPLGNVLLHLRQEGKNLKSMYVDRSTVELNLDLDPTAPLTVVASRPGFRQCGYFSTLDRLPEELHLMLVHNSETLDFAPDLWQRLLATRSSCKKFLESEPNGEGAVRTLIASNRKDLACFLNIIESIQWLPNGKSMIAALESVKLRPRIGGEWAGTQEDRVFIQANKSLVDALENTTAFEKAPHGQHPGADKGFKEHGRFGEANLNLNIKSRLDRLPDSVGAEIDMDYYDDKLAHIALEVIPNLLSKLGKQRLTNPVRTYAMRWMAIRNCKGALNAPVDGREQTGKSRPDFDPLFSISAG